MTWVAGQLVKASDLNAALAACYPAGNVSSYSATLLNQTSAAAWLTALGFPSGQPGQANGLATLDATGHLTASQAPTTLGQITSTSGFVSSPAAANAYFTANAPSSLYQALIYFNVGGIPKFTIGTASGSDPIFGIYNSGLSATALAVDYVTNKVSIPTLNIAGVVTNDASGNLGTVTTTGSGSVVLASGATLTNPTIAGVAAVPTQNVNDNSTKPASTAYVQAQIAAQVVPAPPPPLAITGGLPASMSGTATTAAITISAFNAVDASVTAYISSATSISWAVSNGNAANGYAGGTTLPNSATIHMYACKGSSGVCTYASTTFGMAAASAPAGYNSYVRRLFSFITTSAGSPVVYAPDEVNGGGYVAYFASPITDALYITPPNSSRTLYTLSVPMGFKVEWTGRAGSTGNALILISSPDEPDLAPGAADASPGVDTGGTAYNLLNKRPLITNTSGQLGARATIDTGLLSIFTSGFIDNRRN